jgi:hypothetical protein
MTDHVLVIVPGLGPLALSPDDLRAARAKGRELASDMESAPATGNGAESSPLLDAEQLQARTGIPSTWWMAQARERRVPCHRIGRRVRFDYTEVMASDAVRKRGTL